MRDERAMKAARARLDAMAKPLGSLGLMEDMIVRLAGASGTPDVEPLRACALVFCADNGVVAEGVSQVGSEVTAKVALKMCEGRGNINVLARAAGADVMVVDVGMCEDVVHPNLIDRRIARGTANIAVEPAMSRKQAQAAIAAGIECVGMLRAKGYNTIATGEMGIGNTTTSSALAAVLLDMPPEAVTGRGAGLSDDGLKRKLAAIECAIAVNEPDAADPLDMLAKLGGFDIAAMCGAFIGGAEHGVAVLIDGLISSVAALLAVKLRPDAADHMFASHLGRERACVALMDALRLRAPIAADLALGEGSGAMMLVPLANMAIELYRSGAGMDALNMAPYRRFDG